MIDIIIPAYNAHETIEKTLYSICLQVNRNMFNIYIINDGSKKDYNKICNKFKNILNIKELKLEKNKGPGFARNYGIKNSNSDYILFMDSDDILYDSYSVKNLYDKIHNNNLDIVLSSIYDECEINNYIYYNVHLYNLHGKMFRRSFIEKNNIEFLNTKCNEDTVFMYMAKLLTDKIDNIKLPTYVHQYNKKSITNSKDFWFKNIKIMCENGIILIDFINNRNIDIYKGSYIIGTILMIVYYQYLDFYNRKDSNKIINWASNFYNKSKILLKNLNENDLNNIYYNFYTNKIPEISFYEFIEKLKNN